MTMTPPLEAETTTTNTTHHPSDEDDDDTNIEMQSLVVPSSSPSSSDISSSSKTDLLGNRVIDAIKRSKHHTIRPATLAQELGISIDDASAELCGILAAVGHSASFSFEEIRSDDDSNKNQKRATTMVFQFPSNFEQKCKSYRAKEEARETLMHILNLAYNLIRALISFGLILSLIILVIAVIVVIIAATIAIARGDGRRRGGHDHLAGLGIRRFYSLYRVIRDFLWIYVFFFADSNHDGTDGIRNGLLMSSLCCGDMTSPWFWYRASMLNRRARMGRGWGGGGGMNNNRNNTPHGIRGTWSNNNNSPSTQQSQPLRLLSRTSSLNGEGEKFRGLLSIFMEFLFGPDDQFQSNPSEQSKWKLRSKVIIDAGGVVTLEELLPYVDRPPKSIQDTSQCMWIVSHFNGLPYEEHNHGTMVDGSSCVRNNRFRFPELMLESSSVDYDYDAKEWYHTDASSNSSWSSLFYSSNHTIQHTSGTTSSSSSQSITPRCFIEQTRVLTKLTKEHFTYCIVLGTINFFGIAWLRNTIDAALLRTRSSGSSSASAGMVVSLVKSAIWMLYLYSWLFFALFLARMLVILPYNKIVSMRNGRRLALALQVEQQYKMEEEEEKMVASSLSEDGRNEKGDGHVAGVEC